MARRRLDGVRCPICSKLVLPLDESGCLLEGLDLSPCRHYIGMSSDGEPPVMEEALEDLPSAMERFAECLEVDEPDTGALTAALAGLVPNFRHLAEVGEPGLTDWLECLPEIDSVASAWDGGGLGCNGTAILLFSTVPNQRKLAQRLSRVRTALDGVLRSATPEG